MTEREALKLALEALEVATTPLAQDRQEVLRAQAAIKEILAQPEFVLNGIDCSCGRKWRVVNNTLTASAQPEHEPVARVQFAGGLWKATLLTAVKKLDRSNIHALYTTPPQRTWVGLTKEEVSEIAAQGHQRWLEFYYAIEAKLKEKNT